MLVNKITTGFVIQQFDTEKREFVSQEFVAGDDCAYENTDGESVDAQDVGMANPDGSVPYLPYEMVKPQDLKADFNRGA